MISLFMLLEFAVNDTQENIRTELTPNGAVPLRIAIAGDHTDGGCSVVEVTLRPGAEPPLHLHTREDEVIYVLDGEIDVSLAGIRSTHGPGEAIFLPREQEHGYAAHSDVARILLLAFPAGIEGFHREIEKVDASDGYIERLIVLAARYGIVITGPGLRGSMVPKGDDAA